VVDISDVIELTIPVRADLVVLARLTAATVSARADHDLESIEDLRLAVDELCVSLVRGRVTGRLHLHFVRDGGTVEITGAIESDEAPVPDGVNGEASEDFSSRILDALVDGHGRETIDGRETAWLRKHRAPRQEG